jgi:TatD DNase family protein
VVTFKNGKIDQFLNQIPLERIVLETDAPYLSPAPYRGKRNESGYITHVLKKVAELYNKTELEIANITTKNATQLFNI